MEHPGVRAQALGGVSTQRAKGRGKRWSLSRSSSSNYATAVLAEVRTGVDSPSGHELLLQRPLAVCVHACVPMRATLWARPGRMLCRRQIRKVRGECDDEAASWFTHVWPRTQLDSWKHPKPIDFIQEAGASSLARRATRRFALDPHSRAGP